MAAYYNEIDPYAAQWLRNLIAAGHIAPGDVDERSIEDVSADDLLGYRQCHFFAGIGGWSLALRLSGWPDEREVWTGSCPCQPYSVASCAHGGAQGQGDERHLWPTWSNLIKKRNPAKIFGEQVGSALAWGWWDEVAMDLEAEDYACASSILRADAVGADHQRKRFYWMADSGRTGWEGYQQVDSILVPTKAPLAKYGDPLARARCALDGDYSDLLHCDGLSVVLERHAAKGYGNAIVPQTAKLFIETAMSVIA